MDVARNKFWGFDISERGVCNEFGRIFLQLYAFITLSHSFGGLNP